MMSCSRMTVVNPGSASPSQPQSHGLGADHDGDEQHDQTEDGDELQRQGAERGDGVHGQTAKRRERPPRLSGLPRRDLERNLRARESQPGDEPAEERGTLAQPAPLVQHPAIDQLEVGGILQVVAGDPRRGAIERPGRKPVHRRLPAAVRLHRFDDVPATLAPALHHLGQQRRRMLQVGVHHDARIAGSHVEAGGDGAFLAEVARQPKGDQFRDLGLERRHRLPRPIRRSIVHHDDLEGVAGRADGAADFPQCPRDARLFAIRGHDDGEEARHGCHCSGARSRQR